MNYDTIRFRNNKTREGVIKPSLMKSDSRIVVLRYCSDKRSGGSKFVPVFGQSLEGIKAVKLSRRMRQSFRPLAQRIAFAYTEFQIAYFKVLDGPCYVFV